MTAAARITNLTSEIRDDIRYAVQLAVRYWPNAHLGDIPPREDIHSAFKMLRAHAAHHDSLYAGIGAVEHDAYLHIDM